MDIIQRDALHAFVDRQLFRIESTPPPPDLRALEREAGLTLEEVRAAQLAAGVPPAGPDADDPALVGHAAQLLGYAADDTLVVQFPFGTRASAYAHDIAVLTGDAAAATVVPGREP